VRLIKPAPLVSWEETPAPPKRSMDGDSGYFYSPDGAEIADIAPAQKRSPHHVVAFRSRESLIPLFNSVFAAVLYRQVCGPVRDSGCELRNWPAAVTETAIIVAISLEDSAAKAGMFLPDEKKGEGAS
jgi:hypothetical protein